MQTKTKECRRDLCSRLKRVQQVRLCFIQNITLNRQREEHHQSAFICEPLPVSRQVPILQALPHHLHTLPHHLHTLPYQYQYLLPLIVALCMYCMYRATKQQFQVPTSYSQTSQMKSKESSYEIKFLNGKSTSSYSLQETPSTNHSRSMGFAIHQHQNSKTNFSFQYTASHVRCTMEKLAGDLLLGLKFA